LLHLSFTDALPWSRLAGIFLRAAIAALPVLWLTREVLLPPIVGLAVGGAAYGVAYFGLSYLMVRLTADATLTGTRENLPCAASQA
jgi:hypothetical protein